MKYGLHALIQRAPESEMAELITRRAEDLLQHTRDCPLCDAKRKQALEKKLGGLPPKRRKAVAEAALALAKSL